MKVREARSSLKLAVQKYENDFISENFFFSVLLTGALKGIAKQEEKYSNYLSDVEYSKQSLSLALGAKQYLVDKLEDDKWYEDLGEKVLHTLIALVMPLFVLLKAILGYFKHMGKQIYRNLISIKNLLVSSSSMRSSKAMNTPGSP